MFQLMIFAAGFGKRLAPLTNQTPKPLILINNKPILKHILKHYQDYSVAKPIIINTHYLSEKLQIFFKQYPKNWIQESFEQKILGTGKGLFFAQKKIYTENFWLQNADILCRYNPLEMMKFHQEQGAIVTLATCKMPITPSRVQIGGEKQVIGFEKFCDKKNNDFELQTFCGIHCISKKIFSLFSFDEVPNDIIQLYQILLKRKEKIAYWNIETTPWIDIGSLENLAYAQKNKSQFC